MAVDPIAGFMDDFQAGLPAAPVDPAGIKRMWDATSNLGEERTPSVTGISFRSFPNLGIAEPNFGPVWVRTGLLQSLVRSGRLKPWTAGSPYEERVFDVASKFPVRVGEFDGDEFLRQIGDAE